MDQHSRFGMRSFGVRGRLVVTLAGLAVVVLGAGADQMASSSRGKATLRSRDCLRCHALDGSGGSAAADLGRRVDANSGRVLWVDGCGYRRLASATASRKA